MQVFAHPRWEDFEYRYGKGSVSSWIGDGWTEQEKDRAVNVDYLDDGQIDFPTVPLPSPAPTPTPDATPLEKSVL